VKVYMAARFDLKNEIAEKSQELENLGIKVTSTWPYEAVGAEENYMAVPQEYLEKYARVDIDQIMNADALILFTQDPLIPFCRGGRMHEAGFAQGLGKTLIVCGPKENIFHWLPEVTQFDTWEQLKAALTKAVAV
jgi:nucleoside 2-deoxyribosyltransferase